MSNKKLTDQQKALISKLASDFVFFCKVCIKIQDGEGKYVPFQLNQAQRILLEEIQQQTQDIGRTRLVILKARKLGISTFCAIFFLWRTIFKCQESFILTHTSETTKTLFKMIKQAQQGFPSSLSLKLLKNNDNTLEFQAGGVMRVGTAGSGKGGQRGRTFQNIHWSECDFIEKHDPEDIAAAVLSTMYDKPDTAIILESTGKEPNGFFHNKVLKGLNSTTDYRTIFLPYFLLDEYKRPIPQTFEMTEEEQGIFHQFKNQGITREHIYWRRNKILEIGEFRFLQEYPATVEEAFTINTEDSIFSSEYIIKARRTPLFSQEGQPIYIGIDLAIKGGKDSSIICLRQGRNLINFKMIPQELNTFEVANFILKYTQEINPDAVFIDNAGAGGAIGVIDALRNQWNGSILLQGIDFGGRPDEPERAINKRAEMYLRASEWLEQENGAAINNKIDPSLLTRFCAEAVTIKYKYARTKENQIQIESKQELAKSPDYVDAFVLTFAHDYRRNRNKTHYTRQFDPYAY
jgi:hypothetical protein